MTAMGIVAGKIVAMWMGLGKSEFSHPHDSQLGFVAIFPRTSQYKWFGQSQKIMRKSWEAHELCFPATSGQLFQGNCENGINCLK